MCQSLCFLFPFHRFRSHLQKSRRPRHQVQHPHKRDRVCPHQHNICKFSNVSRYSTVDYECRHSAAECHKEAQTCHTAHTLHHCQFQLNGTHTESTIDHTCTHTHTDLHTYNAQPTITNGHTVLYIHTYAKHNSELLVFLFQVNFNVAKYSVSPDLKYVLFAYDVKQVSNIYCGFLLWKYFIYFESYCTDLFWYHAARNNPSVLHQIKQISSCVSVSLSFFHLLTHSKRKALLNRTTCLDFCVHTVADV